MTGAIVWISSDPQVDTWETRWGPSSGGALQLIIKLPEECILRRVDLYTAPPEIMHAWYADRLDIKVRPGDQVTFSIGLNA